MILICNSKNEEQIIKIGRELLLVEPYNHEENSELIKIKKNKLEKGKTNKITFLFNEEIAKKILYSEKFKEILKLSIESNNTNESSLDKIINHINEEKKYIFLFSLIFISFSFFFRFLENKIKDDATPNKKNLNKTQSEIVKYPTRTITIEEEQNTSNNYSLEAEEMFMEMKLSTPAKTRNRQPKKVKTDILKESQNNDKSKFSLFIFLIKLLSILSYILVINKLGDTIEYLKIEAFHLKYLDYQSENEIFNFTYLYFVIFLSGILIAIYEGTKLISKIFQYIYLIMSEEKKNNTSPTLIVLLIKFSYLLLSSILLFLFFSILEVLITEPTKEENKTEVKDLSNYIKALICLLIPIIPLFFLSVKITIQVVEKIIFLLFSTFFSLLLIILYKPIKKTEEIDQIKKLMGDFLVSNCTKYFEGDFLVKEYTEKINQNSEQKGVLEINSEKNQKEENIDNF